MRCIGWVELRLKFFSESWTRDDGFLKIGIIKYRRSWTHRYEAGNIIQLVDLFHRENRRCENIFPAANGRSSSRNPIWGGRLVIWDCNRFLDRRCEFYRIIRRQIGYAALAAVISTSKILERFIKKKKRIWTTTIAPRCSRVVVFSFLVLFVTIARVDYIL